MTGARCPLVRRFLSLAARDGSAPAVLGPAGELVQTRAALAEAAVALAGRLGPLVSPGDTVLLSLPNGARFLTAFAALRACGAAVALADASSPAAELEAAADAVGARVVVSTPDRMGRADREWPGIALARRADVATVRLPAGTALLKMTSGSSGAPRAFAFAMRQLTADAAQLLPTMGIRPSDVTLAAAPLSHSYGMGNCLGPFFLVGLPLVFPSSLLPAALAETLERARVAHFPAVPAMVRALAALPDLPRLPDLRVILAAGAPLSPRDAEAFRDVTGHGVHVFYGSSECGGITFDRLAEPGRTEGVVGTAVDRVRVEVVDADGLVLPPGREGRVRVCSLGTALGATPPVEDVAVLRHPFFLTGDLGAFDDRGVLTLQGRVSEFVNVAGKKVQPEEVRRALEEVPGVRGAVVVGLPDEHRGQLVAALVAVDPDAGVTVQGLLADCRRRLAPHKLPRRLVLVDELPVTERGKVRRDAVMAMLAPRR